MPWPVQYVPALMEEVRSAVPGLNEVAGLDFARVKFAFLRLCNYDNVPSRSSKPVCLLLLMQGQRPLPPSSAQSLRIVGDMLPGRTRSLAMGSPRISTGHWEA